jgi:nicotinamide mononucleotide adenylyltransferase
MIPLNNRTLGETEIIGGMAKLIEVQMWDPNSAGVKFIINATDYHHDLFEEWEFTNEDEAKRAFADLSARAIC